MKALIPVETVLQACGAFQASRRAAIKSRQEQLIAKAMLEDQRTFWQRVLFRPPIFLDREATIARLKIEEGFWYSRWEDCAVRGHGEADRAEEIRNLAVKVPAGTVVEFFARDSWLLTYIED